jgi:hypothetical protein
MTTARATATEIAEPMPERLTVILPPVLTDEEKVEKALYAGSFTIGDGWGDGYLHCRGDGYGDGTGYGYGQANCIGYGDGSGCGYGDGRGDGESENFD